MIQTVLDTGLDIHSNTFHQPLAEIAFDYVSTSEGLQFNVQYNVPESSRTGMYNILAGEPKDCTPPPFVPPGQ